MPPKSINRQYGAYQIIEMLEATPDSALYHAMHMTSGRMVMLRVLTVRRDSGDPSLADIARQPCLDEIRRVQAIQHAHLMPILDVDQMGAYVFFAMPIRTGGSLSYRLYGSDDVDGLGMARLTVLPSPGEAVRLIEQIGLALQALHDVGYVHGQLEPRNVYLQGSEAFLADTGLLRLNKIIFRLDTTSSFSMTCYSAPEVWEAQRPVAASDQYALACLAYELITGRAPFESPTLLGLMQSHMSHSVRPPHLLRPDLALPQELGYVFWQALAKPFDQRFDSVCAFTEAFAICLRGREGQPTTFFD